MEKPSNFEIPYINATHKYLLYHWSIFLSAQMSFRVLEIAAFSRKDLP
jgi:hypothetical protein